MDIKDLSRHARLFSAPDTSIFLLDTTVQPGLDGEYYCEQRKLGYADLTTENCPPALVHATF
jgi:hypothetical protein